MSAITNSLPTVTDWHLFKRTSPDWHGVLYKTTETTLQTAAAASSDLATLNEPGVYHHLQREYRLPLMKEYKESKEVPKDWITRGTFPGVWCALFHPCNTYSFGCGDSMLKITFKAEYKLFDVRNEEHIRIAKAWMRAEGNLAKTNSWKAAKNARDQSMADRMSCGLQFGNTFLSPQMPGHVEFYRENKFGAAVGYSDYMALVVLLPECIASIEEVK